MYASNLSIALISCFLISSCYCAPAEPFSSSIEIPQGNVLTRDSFRQCLLRAVPKSFNKSNIQQFCTYVRACDLGCSSNTSVDNSVMRTSIKIDKNSRRHIVTNKDVHDFVDTVIVVDKAICVLGGIAVLLATASTAGATSPAAAGLAGHCVLVLGGAELVDAMMSYFKW